MSVASVRQYLRQWGRDGDILELPKSTATVALAAQALGTEPQRIAKTLSFYHGDGALLIVCAGDAKIDNAKYKARFGCKAKMLLGDDVAGLTGHGIGGVCPFALPAGSTVYLDESLRRFHTVYPACGSANSAIELTLPALESCSRSAGWVDVTKIID